MAEGLNAREGRQGERGNSVLWMLVVSLVLLAIATFGLLTWNGANAPQDYASQSQDASRRPVTGSSIGRSSATPLPDGVGVPRDNPSDPRPAQPNGNGGPPK